METAGADTAAVAGKETVEAEDTRPAAVDTRPAAVGKAAAGAAGTETPVLVLVPGAPASRWVEEAQTSCSVPATLGDLGSRCENANLGLLALACPVLGRTWHLVP